MEESVLSGPRLLGDKPNASGKAEHLLMHFCFPLFFFLKRVFKQFFPYFILTFSILPVFFSAFSGGVICISPFFLHVSLSFFYFSTIFSCVTCLSSVCIDWLSGVLRACLTHIQLVCAFPYPLNPYHKDYKSTTS